MRKNSSNKKYSHYINPTKSYGLKLCKGERPVKRNKSGFIHVKGNNSIKHFEAVLYTKSDSSYSSQEFDNYYDNFLKNIQEESVEKNNNVYNPSCRKDKLNKSRKSSGVSSKQKRTSMQCKPYILVNPKSEHNIELQKSGIGNRPEIKISTFGSALTKPENSIEQSFGLVKAVLQNEETPSHHQIKLSLNDNESKFTTNKQIEIDLTPTDKSIINGIPSNNEHNIELINNNNANNRFKNSQLSCVSPKSKLYSIQGSNNLYVKQAENFTLKEQIFLHKTNSKEFPSSPKCSNHINHNIFIKPHKITNTNERVLTCGNNNLFNVIQVNSINSFNNAQKINLCKNKNNTPLNNTNINNNKNQLNSRNQSPRYQFECQSINSSFDKGTKTNDLVIIQKTSSKPLIKKGSNKNSQNNTPLLQFNHVPKILSQRNNDEPVFLSSDFELKDKNKYIYKEKQMISQTPENLPIKDSSHLKTKKYFFCIPCK